VILGFLVTYSLVLGIVFVTVVNDLLGRFKIGPQKAFGVYFDEMGGARCTNSASRVVVFW